MPELTPSNRFDLWESFRQSWPIEKLERMTLEEYNSLGNQDSFCYWLEKRTESLGSICGGSAFKFGIFEFNHNVKNPYKDSAGVLRDDKYKWLKKYGATADEAFVKVKSIIVSVAMASSSGDFSVIDNADLGHATKWKIAFLYQNQSNIKIPCVYLEERLRAFAECYEKRVPTSEIYKRVLNRKSDAIDIFTFSQKLWDEVGARFNNAWLMAPGENARMLEDFINCNMIKLGWNDVGNLSEFDSKKAMSAKLSEVYGNYKEEKSPDKVAAMLWDFCHEIKVGDIIFLKKGRGQIIARGIVKSEYKKIDDDEYEHARDVEWTHVGTWDLPSLCAIKSLTKLNPAQCSQYEKLLADNEDGAVNGTENSEGDAMIIAKDKIPYSLNTIFYGPPGTGKTYTLLNTIAKKYFYEEVGRLTDSERNAKVVADFGWWEVAALCLLDNGNSAKVPQIMAHPLMEAHLKNTSTQHPTNAVWGQLQIHTKEECPNVKYSLERRAEPKVFFKSQDSTWTVDRNLRTEIRPYLLDRLEQYHMKTKVTEIKRFQFITFHQSYSYENFVEGICAETDEDGNIRYDVKPGIFWKFCQQAQNDPEHKYALFIDEINRGNVSGIFGELITLIESDKRGELHVILPYSKKDFCIPKNLYIFGSMNTADRSIDALDSALRRRFSFIEVVPNPELLRMPDFAPKHLHVDLCSLLQSLNRRVEFLLDRDHKIGHSYFMKIQAENEEDELANLQRAFKDQIIPLLEDYFYGNLEKVRMILGDRFIVPAEEDEELTSDCLMCGEGSVEFQDKTSLRVADISSLTQEDFCNLIK